MEWMLNLKSKPIWKVTMCISHCILEFDPRGCEAVQKKPLHVMPRRRPSRDLDPQGSQ